jgi:hypothetical protein
MKLLINNSDTADLAAEFGTGTVVAQPAAGPPVNGELVAAAGSDLVVIEDVISPLDGECVAYDDVDALISLYEAVEKADKRLYATKLLIRDALAHLSEGDAKTRRVAGNQRTAKLTFPSETYDQGIMRDVWESHPDFRDTYLRIASFRPMKREITKLKNTSGTDELNEVRDKLAAAKRDPHGPPTVKIER